MKRFLCIVLSALMLLTLVSCSGEGEPKKTEGNEKEELSLLSAQELYQRGVEKNRALTSARYTTKVLLNGEEISQIETVRVREGYDGFLYSRKGEGLLSFDGEWAYMEGDMGYYMAPATSRLFEEYLSEQVFPVYAISPEELVNFSRDGESVSYESEDEVLLALYDGLSPEEDFSAVSLSGAATFSEEAVITAERITVKGTASDGAERVYTLDTALSEYRSDSIAITQPEDPTLFVEVADIRLPRRLKNAEDSLFTLPQLQATLVSSNTLTLGETKYAYNEDVTVYKKAEEESASYYLSRQSLKQVPDAPEESLFYQCKLENGVKTENQYNVILGEKLSENTENASDIPWEEEIRKLLPSLNHFAALSMAEEVGGYSVSFTLTEAAAKEYAAKIAALLPESGVLPASVSVGECSGTLSVDGEKGVLTAFSYTVSGTFVSGEVSGNFTGRYSVLVDEPEEITLPDLQVPTATTPGM